MRISGVLLLAASLAAQQNDAAAVRKIAAEYVARWLASDDAGVMQLLTSDSVLVPGEKTPIVGPRAIHDYWWPAGTPRVRITRFDTAEEQLVASGDVAAIRGRQTIEWEIDRQRWRTSGNYMMVLQRHGRDWRIAVQMASNGQNVRLP